MKFSLGEIEIGQNELIDFEVERVQLVTIEENMVHFHEQRSYKNIPNTNCSQNFIY